MQERLHKFLAECGIGSRRKCEQIISRGEVAVNGRIITKTGTLIDSNTDSVAYNNKKVERVPFVYLAVYKPSGVVCSCRKDNKYPRIVDIIPDNANRLYPVGRLDVDSEGLVLLTNDGDFCNRIMHPKYGVIKEYIVWLDTLLLPVERAKIESGVEIEPSCLARAAVTKVLPLHRGSKVWLELNEGKNREIRRIFGHLGIKVVRLRRIRIGSVKLGTMNPGECRTLTKTEIKTLINCRSIN